MAAIRKKNESSVIDQIGDDLLSWVSTILQGWNCILPSETFPPFWIHLKKSDVVREKKKQFPAQTNWTGARNGFMCTSRKTPAATDCLFPSQMFCILCLLNHSSASLNREPIIWCVVCLFMHIFSILFWHYGCLLGYNIHYNEAKVIPIYVE